MNDIPVTFYFRGKEVKGILTSVSGAAGSTHFHLMLAGFYLAQFFLTDGFGWQLHSIHDELLCLRDYFERVVISAGQ